MVSRRQTKIIEEKRAIVSKPASHASTFRLQPLSTFSGNMLSVMKESHSIMHAWPILFEKEVSSSFCWLD